MGALDVLEKIRDKFVCVTDLVVSVSFSDEKKVLSLQEAARAVLACVREAHGPIETMRLDSAGLPSVDEGRSAFKLLEQMAGNDAYKEVRIGLTSEQLVSVGDDYLKYGFGDTIWVILTESGIANDWRLDPKTGDRRLSILSSVWKATPRGISILLEDFGYKRPVIISLIRKGFGDLKITLAEELVRPETLDIDHEVDLFDVVNWLSANDVIWPIPHIYDTGSHLRPSVRNTSGADETRLRLLESRLEVLELENARLTKANLELMASVTAGGVPIHMPAHTSGESFPYSTKLLMVMRLAAERFWTNYDPGRPPLQKQVRAFISEHALIPNDRKAAELAGAIKPDNTPEG
ncbi:hypothetical protein YA0729_28335 [Pseudomonas simiae]|uniref:hypothetical protein n=1 Tax=Pseudomonas simiae TaxID=321846 RepID=UPI0018E65F7A|nr:hypothetical protein [Pseudomonas simiae]MBI6616651.1 hypothetical protein [Pseudomonas simiae]